MTDTDDYRFEAAAALRDLSHAFVAHNGDAKLHQQIATDARHLATDLRLTDHRDRLALMQEARSVRPMDPRTPPHRSGFEDRAVAGWANPTSVEPRVQFEEDRVRADVTLGPAFEGAPLRAHGGVVAAVFDDITGYVIGMLNEPAFTGELTVRFVAPVPVNEPLVFFAWLDSRDGRKLYIHSDARAGERVVATCKAIYITVSSETFATAPDPR